MISYPESIEELPLIGLDSAQSPFTNDEDISISNLAMVAYEN